MPVEKLAKFELLLAEQIKTLNFLQEAVDKSLERLERSIDNFQVRCDRRHSDLRNRVDHVEGWQDKCDGYKSGQDWRRQDIYILSSLGLIMMVLLGYVFRGHL